MNKNICKECANKKGGMLYKKTNEANLGVCSECNKIKCVDSKDKFKWETQKDAFLMKKGRS